MLQTTKQIGQDPWITDEIKKSIPEFLELYKNRPLKDNDGGMLSPHMFAIWFILKKINPTTVIESGVWKGQGTWLIENAVPNAKIISIDISLQFREYISPKVKYFSKDFSLIDWSIVEDKENTLLFFDDHQNALERLKTAKQFGFKHFIFEDNYPAQHGDCYTLKKALQHSGFTSPPVTGLVAKIKQLFSSHNSDVAPNTEDEKYLNQNLAVYYEFPPVFKKDKTRWGLNWTEENYSTPEPLYTVVENDGLKMFENEATDYNWICYAKLI